MSITENQTSQDDAPGVATMPSVRVLEEQAMPPPLDDDPGVATIRAALADGTAGSFKKSFNTCLIIWVASRSRMPRRYIWIPLTLMTAPAVLAAHYYWHVFSDLVHLLH